MADEPSGGDLSRLRRLNATAVIRVLREGEPPTVSEVARRTGLSRASAEDVVHDLVERGWVAPVPPVAGSVGRPARRYRFRADAGGVVGIDIGAHKVLAIATDLDGEVLHGKRIAVDPEMGRSARLAAVDRALRAVVKGTNAEGLEIWAVGVGTTGLVDGAGKVMLSDALPEWTGVDLATRVGRTTSGPILVENDSKLAALAETWCGVARHARDVVVILAGLRTGTGLIIDGRLHRGFGNAAGEIGALPAAGWLRAQEHLRPWSGDPDVFAAARDGDREAVAALRRYVRDVGVGVSALVLTLDPELVVIGGGFSRSGDLLVEPLRRELDRWCLRTPQIRVSTLGDRGVALGAVRLALDHVERAWADRGELVSPADFRALT